MVLPYCGSVQIQRQLTRLLQAVSPSTTLRVVLQPVVRLGLLSHLKSPIATLSRSHVIYQVNCNDCTEFYIGKTVRRLSQRLAEHKKESNSAIYKHLQTGHLVNCQGAKVLHSDSSDFCLMVKESLLIRDTAANLSLNANVGSLDLKLW